MMMSRDHGIKGSRDRGLVSRVVPAARRERQWQRSFTLTELLVAMAVIAIITGITALGVRAIAQEAKLSNATNTVVAALDRGRAHAMSSGKATLVAFRPTLVGPNDSRIQVVTAQFTGNLRPEPDVLFGQEIFGRMAPVPGIRSRVLPQGIMVAGPNYFRVSPTYDDLDEVWLIPTDLARTSLEGGEPPGRSVGVLFASDGSVRLQLPDLDATMFWIDMDNNGIQTLYPEGTTDVDEVFNMFAPDEETNIEPVRFLAVFDYSRAREELEFLPEEWADWEDRSDAFTTFINENADRLHFNRYTGVVMR